MEGHNQRGEVNPTALLHCSSGSRSAEPLTKLCLELPLFMPTLILLLLSSVRSTAGDTNFFEFNASYPENVTVSAGSSNVIIPCMACCGPSQFYHWFVDEHLLNHGEARLINSEKYHVRTEGLISRLVLDRVTKFTSSKTVKCIAASAGVVISRDIRINGKTS